MPISLKDQVVLVGGASSGIGRATAVLMAREGAKVMASARRGERLRELKAEMDAEGLALETFTADAADLAQMERLAEATRQKLGTVQIMVGTN